MKNHPQVLEPFFLQGQKEGGEEEKLYRLYRSPTTPQLAEEREGMTMKALGSGLILGFGLWMKLTPRGGGTAKRCEYMKSVRVYV